MITLCAQAILWTAMSGFVSFDAVELSGSNDAVVALVSVSWEFGDTEISPTNPPEGYVYIGERWEEGTLFWEFHDGSGNVYMHRVPQ